ASVRRTWRRRHSRTEAHRQSLEDGFAARRCPGARAERRRVRRLAMSAMSTRRTLAATLRLPRRRARAGSREQRHPEKADARVGLSRASANWLRPVLERLLRLEPSAHRLRGSAGWRRRGPTRRCRARSGKAGAFKTDSLADCRASPHIAKMITRGVAALGSERAADNNLRPQGPKARNMRQDPTDAEVSLPRRWPDGRP